MSMTAAATVAQSILTSLQSVSTTGTQAEIQLDVWTRIVAEIRAMVATASVAVSVTTSTPNVTVGAATAAGSGTGTGSIT